MRKTLLKDTLREIKKTLGRFIAIVAIVGLGTAFFVGIKTTCPDMKLTADKYYKKQNFMDFYLVSTIGFNDGDISSLKITKGVKGVMPSYSIDAVTTLGNKEKVLRISSLPISNLSENNKNYINRPKLLRGRLPQKTGECVIEEKKFTDISLNIGNKIKLTSGDGGILSDKLVTDKYTIVGIIDSPIYISRDRGTTTIGNGQVSAFIEIPDRDFKLKYFNNVYVTADINSTVEEYSKNYDNKIAHIKTILETLAKQRANLRYKEIKGIMEKTFSEKQQQYNNSVNEANKKLTDAYKKITNNQTQINNGKAQFTQNKILSQKSITDGQKQINQGRLALIAVKTDYQAKLDAFNIQKQRAISVGVYETQKTVFDAKETELNAMKLQIDRNEAKLLSKQQQLDKSDAIAQKQISIKQKELNKAQSDLNIAKAVYVHNKKATEQKLAAAKKQLHDAKSQMKDIPTIKWYVLDRNANLGYVDYGSAADRMDAIAQVFPVIFILVAILICFTSMSRMVEEQRSYMGTMKALGYSKITIAVKFLLYSILASIIGGIIGLFIGFDFFPRILFKAYSIMYTMPKIILTFDMPFAAISIIVGVSVTSLAAVIVCFDELNSSAATLMRPRAPKAGKVILLERVKFIWKRLKFTQKVTARNLFRYKSRFFMTVIGVGGCTALLLVGFGLRDAIRTIGDKQFGEIYTYQINVNIKDNTPIDQTLNIENVIKQQSNFLSMESLFSNTIEIGFKNNEKSCNFIVPDNPESINQFIDLRIRTTGKGVPLSKDGIVLTEKLANMLGVRIGDDVYIKNGDTEKLTAKVSGICENYLQHFVYMSPILYEKLYHTKPSFNQINVKLKSSDPKTQEIFSKNIVSLKGIASVNLMSDHMKKFNDTIKSIYNIVIVLIVSAGLLSFIVLFTLTNININERMREIATIKVLGFYDKEVSAYVFRENLILAFVGACFGLIIGNPLTRYVIGTAEVEMVMFGRQIYPLSFLLAVILTLAFAFIVNTVMLRSLKNINMVESLKTIE